MFIIIILFWLGSDRLSGLIFEHCFQDISCMYFCSIQYFIDMYAHTT